MPTYSNTLLQPFARNLPHNRHRSMIWYWPSMGRTLDEEALTFCKVNKHHCKPFFSRWQSVIVKQIDLRQVQNLHVASPHSWRDPVVNVYNKKPPYRREPHEWRQIAAQYSFDLHVQSPIFQQRQTRLPPPITVGSRPYHVRFHSQSLLKTGWYQLTSCGLGFGASWSLLSICFRWHFIDNRPIYDCLLKTLSFDKVD